MFEIKFNYSAAFLLTLFLTTNLLFAQPTPPNGKKWVKIEQMSDEFNGSDLNPSKWAKSDPQWAGRVPGKFKANTISVSDGKLKVTNYKLDRPEGRYTHAGGMVRGLVKNTYGYYETRMKASKTFMSSTFWLFNKRNEFNGCDVRTTELDITETVGFNSNGASWVDNNIKSMNSNTHSRETSCNSTPIGMEGNKASLGGGKSYEAFHTYGAWWKNKDEVLFYLDGKFVGKVDTPSDFNLGMYLRLVTETYDWNPTPKDGGMTGSAESRTTYYDWVHSYRLVDSDNDDDNTVDKISFNNVLTEIPQQISYSFDVTYEAATDREIVVEFWSPTRWLAQEEIVVPRGAGTQTITVDLNEIPEPGRGYVFKTHIRPLGTDWQDALDRDQINDVTVSETLSTDRHDTINFSVFPNPSKNGIFNIKLNSATDASTSISVYNLIGKKVFQNTLETNATINLSNLSSGLYLMEVNENGKTATKKIIIEK